MPLWNIFFNIHEDHREALNNGTNLYICPFPESVSFRNDLRQKLVVKGEKPNDCVALSRREHRYFLGEIKPFLALVGFCTGKEKSEQCFMTM